MPRGALVHRYIQRNRKRCTSLADWIPPRHAAQLEAGGTEEAGSAATATLHTDNLQEYYYQN